MFLEARDIKLYMLKICILKMRDLVRRTDILKQTVMSKCAQAAARTGQRRGEWKILAQAE